MDTQTQQTTLSETEIVRAATNDAALSDMEVELGGRKFKIVDLPYDEYLAFLAQLQPLMEAVISRFTGEYSDLPTDSVSISSLMKYCAQSLPQMAWLSLKQTDDAITIEDVKRLGKTPFRLASVVLKQIERNRMIAEIADFFVQLSPLLRSGKEALRLTQGETP